MAAKKTPLKAEIKERLAALNDQLQFFLFIEMEFFTGLSSLSPEAPNSYTSEVFSQNRHAERINVRIRDLSRFQFTNRSLTFGAYFSTSYEIASDFFGSALRLTRETNGPTFTIPKKTNEGPERHYYRTVSTNGCIAPPSRLIDTFAYFRHRRNAFIHLHDRAASPYAKLAKSNGEALNSYWGAIRDNLQFSSANIGAFTEEETISLVKLLRIGIERLDAHLASILDERGIVTYCAQRQFGNEPVRINADVVKLRQKELTPIIQRDFGFSPSLSLVEKEVRAAGVR